jgi:hypothetical protein
MVLKFTHKEDPEFMVIYATFKNQEELDRFMFFWKQRQTTKEEICINGTITIENPSEYNAIQITKPEL